MTNRFTTLAAAAALFLGLSAPASAGDMAPIGTIGHWQITANETLCKAHGEYQDGTNLEFAINAKGGLSISIGNNAWAIPEGKYEITMQVDRTAPTDHAARAKANYVVWFASLDEATVNRLSYGNALHVKVGYQAFHYKLARSEAVMKALVQCAAPRMAAANPFAASPPAAASNAPATPFPETASNPYRRM
jgi:hypothetical protein